jgi:WD40 repeat protein
MRIIQSDNPRPLNLLALGPGGLVSAASDTFGVASDIEVWDAATGARRFVHAAPDHSAAGAVAFTPDGRYLLVGDPQFAVIEATTAKVVAHVATRFDRPDFALSADGTRIIVSTSWNQCGAVECFAVGPDLDFRPLWIDGPPHELLWFDAVAITRDGKLTSVVQRVPFGGTGGRPALDVSVRNAETGQVLFTNIIDPASPPDQLAFTADGAKLLVRTDSRIVQMFDATTGAPAGELVHAGRPYVTAIAVHPRGPVACARTNGTVTFWEVPSAKPEGFVGAKRAQLRTLDWKAGKLVSVAFSPDGALAAAGTEDGKIVVWDVDL